MHQRNVREIKFFSRSVSYQGILRFVRETGNLSKFQGNVIEFYISDENFSEWY